MATERWIFGILYLVACVQTETEEFEEAPDLPADDETETEEFEEAPDLPADDEWPTCENTFLDGKYSMIHSQYCDRFFACQHGVPFLMQCEDGFGYLPFRGCKLLHLVDCGDRPKLQRPRGNKECPRLYGLFPDPRGCGRFFKCVNGTATEDQCGTTLIFDDKEKVCKDMTKEEIENCQEPNLLGCTDSDGGTTSSCTWFQCPLDDILPFGDHSRHPFPGNCHRFIICLRDGSIKIGGCVEGSAFDPDSTTCEPQETVKGCSNDTMLALH